MTDKQQPEALRLANVCSNLTRYSMDAHLIAAYLRSQHAELETLRAGYAAARLEIESLRAAQPAGAQQPGAAYAALSDVDSLAQEIRRVDGAHRLGAGALAEALMPFLRASHGQAPAPVLHLVNDAFAEVAMAYPKAFALHKVGIADTAVREALAAPATAQAADSVQEDAARYRFLRDGNDSKHSAAWHVAVNLYGCEWDAAIDAALAAQEGGK
jgi:hypothetical protein